MILELIFKIESFIFKLGCSNSEKSVKIRSKQQDYSHLVKSTYVKRQALSRSRCRHGATGSDLHYLPSYYSLAVSYLKIPNKLTCKLTSVSILNQFTYRVLNFAVKQTSETLRKLKIQPVTLLNRYSASLTAVTIV